MRVGDASYRTVRMEGGAVVAIDQLLLPHRFTTVTLRTHRETADAISRMVVRGAGAIGSAGAYGMAQVYAEAQTAGDGREAYITKGAARLAATRPTARNLFYALERVQKAAVEGKTPAEQAVFAREAAEAVADEDAESCRRIGEAGKALLGPDMRVLTHCNAGWLAFTDWGSALSPIYAAHREGVRLKVYADETRPRLQGALLTAWELMGEGVDVTVVPDNAAGLLMRRGMVDLVLVGADRIARNGDTANKIGTYEKAVLAKENGVPFYVAAPLSTFDPACPDGDAIPIEERGEEEVLVLSGALEDGGHGSIRLAPEGARALNFAFDVTPAQYITGFITERGVVKPEALLQGWEDAAHG